MSASLTLHVLRFLPRNLLSRAFGWLARLERPAFVVRHGIRFFARRFEVDVNEAEQPLSSYPSLLAFFTRKLAPGRRPIVDDRNQLVSPVDACVGAFGRIENGQLVQAKGLHYAAEALLGSREAAAPFQGGWFATLYLSPRDYHRIHAPDGGRIIRSLYEPGTLWPVNPPAVRTIPSLFAVNERVTTLLETPQGPVAVVMVGATNVGSIRLAYADLVTNQRGRREVREHRPAIDVARGAELGTFQMGSTVILLVSARRFEWSGLEAGKWLPMGSGVGRYLSV